MLPWRVALDSIHCLSAATKKNSVRAAGADLRFHMFGHHALSVMRNRHCLAFRLPAHQPAHSPSRLRSNLIIGTRFRRRFRAGNRMRESRTLRVRVGRPVRSDYRDAHRNAVHLVRVNEFFGFFPGRGVEGAPAHALSQSIDSRPPATDSRQSSPGRRLGPSAINPPIRRIAGVPWCRRTETHSAPSIRAQVVRQVETSPSLPSGCLIVRISSTTASATGVALFDITPVVVSSKLVIANLQIYC